MPTAPRSLLRPWLRGLVIALVVMVIAYRTLPLLVSRSDVHGKTMSAETDLSNLSTALNAFNVDVGRYPTATEGFSSLMHRPPTVRVADWKGPYMEELRSDPWGTPYEYAYPLPTLPTIAPTLRSAGPDRHFDTPDDLTNAPAPR